MSSTVLHSISEDVPDKKPVCQDSQLQQEKEEEAPQPDNQSDNSCASPAKEPTDAKPEEQLKSEVKESTATPPLQNDVSATAATTAASPTTTAAVITAAPTISATTSTETTTATTTTAEVINVQKESPSIGASPVALDGETEKSDTACAPDPSEKTAQKDANSSPGQKQGTSNALNDKVPPESVYHVKWVQFKSQSTAIVTQNENGPCPLLAIMNCLLLQGRVKLPAMMEMVTSSQLMEYLGDCILENTPKVFFLFFYLYTIFPSLKKKSYFIGTEKVW